MNLRTALLLSAPLVLYVLALNPYIRPGNLDGALYYDVARSLAEEGHYQRDGQQVARFPPGFPVMLALPMWLGMNSVWASKIVVLLMVAAGIPLTHRLLLREGYSHPVSATVISWLAPAVMYAGTSLLSEVPFLTLALLFLWLLHMQRVRFRGVGFAILVGCVLGCAALTRWMGVLLGAALIAQAIQLLCTRGKISPMRRCLPELVASTVGASIFLGWILIFVGGTEHLPVVGTNPAHRLKPTIAMDDPPPPWLEGWLAWEPVEVLEDGTQGEAQQTEYFQQARPTRPFAQAADLLFARIQFLRALGLSLSHPLSYLFWIPLVLVLVGMIARVRARRFSPADWTMVTYLTSLVVLDWSPLRYWIVITPFLVAHTLSGAETCWSLLRSRFPTLSRIPALQLGLAGWIVLLVGIAGLRTFLPNSPRGPLFYPLASRPELFYIGSYYGNLLRCCEAITQDGRDGPVLAVGPNRGDVGIHLPGREIDLFPPATQPAYLLVMEPQVVPESLVTATGLELLATHGRFSVYRVPPAARQP